MTNTLTNKVQRRDKTKRWRQPAQNRVANRGHLINRDQSLRFAAMHEAKWKQSEKTNVALRALGCIF